MKRGKGVKSENDYTAKHTLVKVVPCTQHLMLSAGNQILILVLAIDINYTLNLKMIDITVHSSTASAALY